jgi:hypothetical protein
VTLVDTSVWIDLFRKSDSAATRLLNRLIDEDTIVLAPVVLQELLMGARNPEQLAKLQRYFAGIETLLPSRETYALAGALYARCRWAGITPRSPHDCLVAATAIEHDLRLLCDDVDFPRIAGVEPRLRLVME